MSVDELGVSYTSVAPPPTASANQKAAAVFFITTKHNEQAPRADANDGGKGEHDIILYYT